MKVGGHGRHKYTAAQTLRDRLGPAAHQCLLDAFANHTEYQWMLEEHAKRLDPPATWRRAFAAFDGIALDGSPRARAPARTIDTAHAHDVLYTATQRYPP